MRVTHVASLCALIVTAGISGCTPSHEVAHRQTQTTMAAGSAVAPGASALAGGPVYVAIGASDTYGYGVPDPAREGWVPRFAAALPPHWQTVNLGVVGLTTRRALQVDLPVALDARPDLVTVWLAVDDLLDGVSLHDYTRDMRSLLQGLRQHTQAHILVGNIPDLAVVPTLAGRLGPGPGATIVRWNAAIAQVGQDSGAQVVDLYRYWSELASHPEYVGQDGLHPSVAGYQRIADIFRAAL